MLPAISLFFIITVFTSNVIGQGFFHGDMNAVRPIPNDLVDYYNHVAKTYRSLMEDTAKIVNVGEMSENLGDHLSRFEEAATISYNVSELCMNQTLTTINDLVGGQLYALSMFDAWAKIPPGILSLNLKWTGAYQQCLLLTSANKTGDEDYGAQYCMTALDGIDLVPAAATGGLPLPIKFAVCMPDGCSADDVIGLLNSALSLVPTKKALSVSAAECTTETTPYTAGDIIALVICAVFLLFALLGTGFDYYKQWRKATRSVYVNGDVSDDVTNDLVGNLGPDIISDSEQLVSFRENKEESTESIMVEKFLLAFSVLKNGDKLFDISNTQKDIQILHGIRAISMSWVILGHVHLFYVLDYDNLSELFLQVLPRWTFQAIGNATFSVDTFFFLSGLLVTYLTLKYMRNNDGQMRWGMFYVHRYLRLTPVYALCLLLFTTLFNHLPYVPQVSGSLLGTTRSNNPCKKYWWSNLLYINNFVPLDNGQMCFGWAWYLANDMQFYVISPFILIALYKKPRVGFGILAVLTLLCLGVTGFISSYFGQFGLVFGITPPGPRHLYDAKGFDYIYGKPYTRISTYLVGMATGYILYLTRCRKNAITMKPAFVLLGWALAWANALAVLYGFANDIKEHYVLSYDLLAFYTSVSRRSLDPTSFLVPRFAWSLSLAWLTVACVHGYGGPITTILEWKFWIPMSRLTYCAYLVHPIWIMFHAQIMSVPLHYDDMTMIYVYIGGLVCSYSVAMVVSLLVEAPLIALEKLCFGR